MEKLQLEFTLKTSVKVLYQMLSTPSGLSRWFAEDVNINRDGTYSFIWDGSEEIAELVSKRRDEFVKYKWVEDEEASTFFEFRIQIDPMTNDVALIVTDFCDEGEEEETSDLWSKQVETLRQSIGG
ncbi:MAG: SRPBCC domain-containing protein [Flavobacteriales bacterium]|nr:SRPBCC domain-containing protein [Flavobacteriales bacterium]